MSSIFQLVDECFIIVLKEEVISDQQWSEWVSAVKVMPAGQQIRMLVDSDYGPSAMQRKEMNEALGSRRMRIAVLSDSSVAKGIMFFVNLSKKIDIKGFSPYELDAALQFLGYEGSSANAIRNGLLALRQKHSG